MNKAAKRNVWADPLTAKARIDELEEQLRNQAALHKRIAELEAQAEEWKREWDILESACDFWKQEAINRGYEE